MTRGKRQGMEFLDKSFQILQTFMKKEQQWVANPAEIERERGLRVSRVWAGEACGRLASQGLLEVEKRIPRRRGHPTPHYRLPVNPAKFYRFVQELFRVLKAQYDDVWADVAQLMLLQSPYGRRMITRRLVLTLLEEDETVAYRRCEKLERHLILRVSTTPERGMQDAIERNVLTRRDAEQSRLFVEEHYTAYQEKWIVAPLLSLIQVSPSALERFLREYPESSPDGPAHIKRIFQVSTSGIGVLELEPLLADMIMDTVRDLEVSRQVPKGLEISTAEVCPTRPSGVKWPELLVVERADHDALVYGTGFDTRQQYETPQERMQRSEQNAWNTWVKVGYRDSGGRYCMPTDPVKPAE